MFETARRFYRTGRFKVQIPGNTGDTDRNGSPASYRVSDDAHARAEFISLLKKSSSSALIDHDRLLQQIDIFRHICARLNIHADQLCPEFSGIVRRLNIRSVVSDHSAVRHIFLRFYFDIECLIPSFLCPVLHAYCSMY